MSDNTQNQPTLDDVRDVLHLAFMLLLDSDGLDALIAGLAAWSGLKPDGLMVTGRGSEAANLFVFNALAHAIEAQEFNASR